MSTELISAAKNGYHSKVMALLSEGHVDVDARDKDRATPLYWSACRGNAAICRALIKAGCDVNASVKWGSTALHAAADRNNVDCLTTLIDSGVNVDVQNERGDTALHLAAYRGFRDIVDLLLTAGADPFTKNLQNKTPLQEAQSRQHAATAILLQMRMEELGCVPFKSLQHGHLGLSSPDDRPAPSVQAKSWPHYPAFPRYLDADTVLNTVRPGTTALPAGMNNLSACHPARSHETAFENTLCRVSEGIPVFRGSPGLNDLNSGDEIYLHAHSEPQESVDDSVDGFSGQKMVGVTNQHNMLASLAGKPSNKMTDNYGTGGSQCPQFDDGRSLNGGDGTGHRNGFLDTNVDLLLNYVPTHHGQVVNGSCPPCVNCPSSVRMLTNGIYLPPPDITAPRPDITPHRHVITAPKNAQTTNSRLNIDDLAMYAESLQMEVVRLRETVTSKDTEIAEMRRKISALEKQASGLQQLAKAEQEASGKVIECKESELSEQRRKILNLENLVATLQRAFESKDSIAKDALAVKENEVKVLNLKIGFLESQVTSLQQLAASKETSLEKTLSAKETELRELQSRFQVLGKEIENLREASRRCSGNNCLSERGAATAKIRDTEMRDGFPACLRAPLTCAREPTLNCFDTVLQSTTAANFVSLFSELRRQHGRNWLDVVLKPLKVKVSTLFQEEAEATKLDADGREWQLERDFRLLDTKPVNCSEDGERRGSCSLVFSIEHKGRRYVLKMLMNLINLHYDNHSRGRSLDAHLLYSFGTEFHAPLLLNDHPNIVRVRHHFQGDTAHFRTYLPLLVPPSLDVPVDMARRTTFLVMDEYPLTLQSFLVRQRASQPEPPYGMPEMFVLQLLYQLVSAVEYLQRHHIVHRDIKADNVFLDWRLRPLLGDFGLARTLRTFAGEAIPFEDAQQARAGNSHAWAPELSRLNRDGPQALSKPVTLDYVYSKTDAYAVSRMMLHLLRPIWDDPHSDGFPTSTPHNPHYKDSDIPLLLPPFSPALCHALKQMVLNEPSHRPSARQALSSIALLMMQPSGEDLGTQEAAEDFCAAQLMKLAALGRKRCCQPADGTLPVEDSIAVNHSHLLADALVNISSKEFWEASADFRRLNLPH